MSLKEIYCQQKAIGTLQKALACGKPAHAYIFAGAEGVGNSRQQTNGQNFCCGKSN